ncbi:MAG: hypothetical protein JWM85_3077 [Acidimicrobiaceae bacterium]|nr:hypothetical protein [Acidimicrobiaceae bacterium]
MSGASSAGSSVQQLLLGASSAVLSELGWSGAGEVEDGTLFAAYTGASGESWVVVADTFADQDLLLVYSLAPEPVAPERREAVAEYLTRANDGLPRACFEIDLETGVVRCRTWLDVEGLDVAALDADGYLLPLVRRVLLANVATFDLFFSGLRAVEAGSSTPTEADAAVQAGPDS